MVFGVEKNQSPGLDHHALRVWLFDRPDGHFFARLGPVARHGMGEGVPFVFAGATKPRSSLASHHETSKVQPESGETTK